MNYKKYKIQYNHDKNVQEAGALLSCVDYYNNDNYCFATFSELRFFLNYSVFSDSKFKNTSYNTQSNYNGTILDELIKIDFNMARYDELPELVKLLLNLKPKPAYLLEFLFTKGEVETIKSILTNTYTGSYFSAGYAVTKAIHNLINPQVVLSINQILNIIPEGTDLSETNTWDSLTKLLEFVSCLLDSSVLTSIPGVLDNIKNKLKNEPIQIVFLDNLLYNPNIRMFKKFYPFNTKDCENQSNIYRDFVLKDFFDPTLNTISVLPPSVLLFISIRLNPIINKRGNFYNTLFRESLDYTRFKCDVSVPENISRQVERFIQEPKPEFTEADSELLDQAMLPIVNSGNVAEETQQTKYSLLNKFGYKYNDILNNIYSNINKPLSSILKSYDIFKDKNVRVSQLKAKIDSMNSQKAKLLGRLPTAKATKTFGLFKSEKEKIEEEIKNLSVKIQDYNSEILLLNGVSNATVKEKINYLVAILTVFFGFGMYELNDDVCSVGDNDSSINWRTFDKLLKNFDGNIFKVVSFFKSKFLTHTLLQNITLYTVYLPFDIRSYFYQKLKLDTPEKIQKFNYLYDQYEKKIYEDFIHEDGYYYTEPDKDGNRNVHALFPSGKLLEDIKNSLDT